MSRLLAERVATAAGARSSRRRFRVALLVTVVGALIGFAVAAGAGAQATSGAGTAADTNRAANRPLGVTGKEFSLVLSRRAVGPGETRVEFQNGGEDDHDLLIRRRGASRTTSFGVVAPGDRLILPVRFRARSDYRLWCSIADHRKRGMRAELRVKRR